MDTLQRILVTTDFSLNARKVYAYAAHLSHKFGATIHLAHFGHRCAPAYSGISDESHRRGLRWALSEEARYGVLANIPVKLHLLNRRRVGESLQSLEREVRHDLVVTSTSACTGWRRFFLRNFGEQITANATVPILMCGPLNDANDTVAPRRVLVPFDFSDAAQGSLRTVRFLAAHYHSAFRFLFVYETHRDRIGLYKKMCERSAVRPEATEQRFAALKQGQLAGIDVELDTCQGVPAVEIVHRAGEMEADLVIIGTQGVHGSLAQNVTRQAKCPVLVVPWKTVFPLAFSQSAN